MKCTQHIRVDKIIVHDIRVNAIVVQEIGNNLFKCSQHIRVRAVNHGRSQASSHGLKKGVIYSLDGLSLLHEICIKGNIGPVGE